MTDLGAISLAVCLLVVAALSGATGWMLGHDAAKPVQMTWQPPVRQDDGSLVVERQPVAEIQVPHQLPEKAKPTRQVEVRVEQADCPPADLILTLADTPEGSRVIAHAPDPAVSVSAAIDRVLVADRDRRRLWAAGVSYDPFQPDRRRGVWLERDFGRVRIGAEFGEGRTLLRAGFTW